MPSIRLTGFFKDDDGHGWSETHDKDGGTSITGLTTFISAFNTLMVNYRRPLLAGDAFYIGCRASYKAADGTRPGDNFEMDPPMRGPQTFSGEVLTMTAPEAAIKMRLRNDSSTARSDAYLRGFWKQVIDAGVIDASSPAGAEWKRRADLYAGALVTNSYGWVGINPALTSRGKVTGYVLNDTGTVTLTLVPQNGVPLPVAGTRLAVSFARINRSKSILNRTFVCVVQPGATTVETTELIGAFPFETEGTYIAKVTGFIPYAALSYYKLSKRATGRPFGVAPGRARVQTLH
jgi:hypothetical protein